jgi:hypothetical protein
LLRSVLIQTLATKQPKFPCWSRCFYTCYLGSDVSRCMRAWFLIRCSTTDVWLRLSASRHIMVSLI